MSVPKSLQPAFDGIEPLITDFCNQYLNDEYRELCLHLLEKLCRKRPSPRYYLCYYNEQLYF